MKQHLAKMNNKRAEAIKSKLEETKRNISKVRLISMRFYKSQWTRDHNGSISRRVYGILQEHDGGKQTTDL